VPDGGKVGLVFAGGGARGAYEAGVMAELLPDLERRDQRPDVIVGTSVGAINAARPLSFARAETRTNRERRSGPRIGSIRDGRISTHGI